MSSVLNNIKKICAEIFSLMKEFGGIRSSHAGSMCPTWIFDDRLKHLSIQKNFQERSGD